MGDSSNIYIQTERNAADEEWDGIGLYSHWGGEGFQERALDALAAARDRIGDPSYFARIITAHVIDSVSGIWVRWPDDNEYDILVINAETGGHWYVPARHTGKPWRADRTIVGAEA